MTLRTIPDLVGAQLVSDDGGNRIWRLTYR